MDAVFVNVKADVVQSLEFAKAFGYPIDNKMEHIGRLENMFVHIVAKKYFLGFFPDLQTIEYF
jgi:hypothetical protein